MSSSREASGPHWDTCVRQFDGGWFTHLNTWADFIREVSGGRFVADLSFTIVGGTEVVALCPVMLESGPDGLQFSMAQSAIPFPAIKPGLPPSVVRKAYVEYFDRLAGLATQHDVGHAVVSQKFPVDDNLVASALARAGFFDVSQQTQVIDLAKREDQLWADIRKGHRSDIKRAAAACKVRIWDSQSVTAGKFGEYQALHAKDAGRVTRSQRSFDIMHDWVREGLAILAETSLEGTAIAFALVMNFKGKAYYGSACQDPDHARSGASHLLQWEIIRWLKLSGGHAYDIGLQHFGPLWHQHPSAKDVTIADFKRGFGGRTVPVVAGEYFYSLDTLLNVTNRRLDAYRAARTAEPSTH